MGKPHISTTTFIGATMGGVPGLLDTMRSFKGVTITQTMKGRDVEYLIYGDWSVPGNEVAEAMQEFERLNTVEDDDEEEYYDGDFQ